MGGTERKIDTHLLVKKSKLSLLNLDKDHYIEKLQTKKALLTKGKPTEFQRFACKSKNIYLLS